MSDEAGSSFIPSSSRTITQNRSLVVATPAAVQTAQLTNASTTLYTAPSRTTPIGSIARAKLTSIVFCNTDSSARTVTVYLIESGGSVADNRAILKDVSIPAKTTWVFDAGADGIPLANAETIRGLASVTLVVTYRISVVEFL